MPMMHPRLKKRNGCCYFSGVDLTAQPGGTMPTPEQTLYAYQILDFVKANPAKHDQATWWDDPQRGATVSYTICHTVGCWAGWVVAFKPGWSIVWVDDLSAYFAYDSAGVRWPIPDAADEILGIGSAAGRDSGVHSDAMGLDNAVARAMAFCPLDKFSLYDASHCIEDLEALIPVVFGPRPESVPPIAPGC